MKAKVNGLDIEYEYVYGHARPKTAQTMIDLVNYGIRLWNLQVPKMQADKIKKRLEKFEKKERGAPSTKRRKRTRDD